MNIIVALIVGAISGFLAGKISKGRGFGLIGNIIVGLIGGFLGNFLFGLIGFGFGPGIVGAIITSVVGALILLAILNMVKK